VESHLGVAIASEARQDGGGGGGRGGCSEARGRTRVQKKAARTLKGHGKLAGGQVGRSEGQGKDEREGRAWVHIVEVEIVGEFGVWGGKRGLFTLKGVETIKGKLNEFLHKLNRGTTRVTMVSSWLIQTALTLQRGVLSSPA